ncbi:MAG: ATP-dependent zinc metalloprotease FtsH, partial [Acidimicrobiales bacterium]
AATTTVPAPAAAPACSGPPARFHASYPRSDVSTQALIERLARSGATVVVDKQTGTAVAKLVLTFILPLLLLANLFGLIFLSRGGDSSIADIAGFGKVGRKRQRRRRLATGVTFADVAGAQEAVEELREVTDYLRDPGRFKAYGAAAPKGVLLFGPPGCGKTLLARAVAGESKVAFFSISGAEFVESLVGVGAARVRDLFAQVRDVAPAIVFIDEIDAVGRRRTGEGSSGGEREQTVNQLLVEMDGFEVSGGIVVMGATNRPDILDPALLRPGRFDRHVTLEPPDVHGRQAILELHARNKPMADDADFGHLARRTPGFTGADLANVINEAALLALRQGKGARIAAAQLAEAVQRVLHGPQRRGRLMTAEERTRLAFHEAGHAVVAAALGRRANVHRVSIVARGRGLGHTAVAEDAERVLLTKSELEAHLAVAMAGVAAEELVFGEASTTAQDDVARATDLAREMAGRYGMAPGVGRLRLLRVDDGFLGEPATLDPISGHLQQGFDQEVVAMIERAEQQAGEILDHHRDALDQMATGLEAEETLEGLALDGLLAAVRPGEHLLGGRPGEPVPATA